MFWYVSSSRSRTNQRPHMLQFAWQSTFTRSLELSPPKALSLGLLFVEPQCSSGSLSGAIGSESFDVKASKENLKKFFALISLSLTCNKRLLGFDPTFIDDQGPHTAIQIVTDTGTQELVIDHPHIFRAAGICGRGTTCWKAHLSVDERQTFLIKDSWQPKDRREEGVMLRDVTENNVPHVARYHHHEDVHVAGNSVDIESHVRRGANFQTCQTIKITDEPNDPQVPHGFINRVHRRLILKDVGQPIWTVDSPVHLLKALELKDMRPY
ncbi:hypothetical protein PGTUg99_028776 [Puccinia graminis f. sp. tritici]|uniref:Fungal-type protein kinase domain-containing protein n=1 Tax=Puccinia graminis f. sp. tritici TaxID=56615 RepID=A0A5B0Q7V2_PUCGR|nr:hypothetical protein PGTUg99_028776 [Puccinia graminis f. sp. tritici]